MISRVALPKKSDSECAAIDHVQSGGTWTSAVERTRASCKRAQNVRFVIFYPKRSLPIHPSFEMHYVYKEEKKTANVWDDPNGSTYKRVEVPVPTEQFWTAEIYTRTLSNRALNSTTTQSGKHLKNESDLLWFQVSSYRMQFSDSWRLSAVWEFAFRRESHSKPVSFLEWKLTTLRFLTHWTKENLSSPFCASRLHEDDHHSVRIAKW